MKAFNKDKALRKLKFKQNRGKYIKYGSIVLSCLILVIGIIMFTFAKFESTSEWTLIDGTVTESSKDANIVAIYQGDNKVDSVPAKNSGWYFDRAECTNGANAIWNNERWSIDIQFSTKTKCSVYFTDKPYKTVSGDLATVGSVVKIANEEFYVIGQEDASHVKLLSKWNLNVGNNTQPGEQGIQNSKAIGYNNDLSTSVNNYYPATVAFSSTNYWYDGSALKSEYGSSYPAYVYDNNASIKTYVDNYVTYLTNQGVNVTGRLISHEELVGLGCNASTYWCDSSGTHGGTAPEWVYQTSYWSGSADGSNYVWSVNSRGSFGRSNYDYDNLFGVRPVIILES